MPIDNFSLKEGAIAILGRESAAGGPDRLTASFRAPKLQPGEYLLKALTSQSTEVDGVTMQRDQELPIRPGSCIKLADVMTLDFVSPSLADEGTMGATLGRPRVSLT